jgi:hypothetical protein
MKRFLFCSCSLAVVVPSFMLGPEFFVNQGVSTDQVEATMKLVAVVSLGALALATLGSLFLRLLRSH